MCTEQLPPGGYPIAVKYIISYPATDLKYIVITSHFTEEAEIKF
jgi:hypothetical protein